MGRKTDFTSLIASVFARPKCSLGLFRQYFLASYREWRVRKKKIVCQRETVANNRSIFSLSQDWDGKTRACVMSPPKSATNKKKENKQTKKKPFAAAGRGVWSDFWFARLKARNQKRQGNVNRFGCFQLESRERKEIDLTMRSLSFLICLCLCGALFSFSRGLFHAIFRLLSFFCNLTIPLFVHFVEKKKTG